MNPSCTGRSRTARSNSSSLSASNSPGGPTSLRSTRTPPKTPISLIAATATLNYSGAESSNAPVPSVPDWLDGAPSGAVMELGHYDAGSTPETSGQPRLFEVMLPARLGGLLGGPAGPFRHAEAHLKDLEAFVERHGR